MAEVSKAFVVGGFSESKRFLEGFTNVVSNGPDRIVEDAEPITLGWAFANSDKFNKEAENRIVFFHSAGGLVVRKARIAVAMNAAEPNPLGQTLKGAIKVGTNGEIGREEGLRKTGLRHGAMEVARHPSTLAVALLVREFSTLKMLVAGGTEAFPEGRLYLPSHNDEFGFGSYWDVMIAQANGITAEMQDGFHNQPLLHPTPAVKRIGELLNENA